MASTDIQVVSTETYFLPVSTRTPLKFGAEVLRHVLCLRVRATVRDDRGRTATGWGETPLSVQWAWPSPMRHRIREDAMVAFCQKLADAWAYFDGTGHALELGIDFQTELLPKLLASHNASNPEAPMPYLAALICDSAFDIAVHDAYGNLHGVDIYETYQQPWLNRDLSSYMQPANDRPDVSFAGRYPNHFFAESPSLRLPVWHLVGGVDPLEPSDLTGDEPDDEYPVLLRDWIQSDGLNCLKVKLRGVDAAWDLERMKQVGRIAVETGVLHLSADFNCQAQSTDYVNQILDHLSQDEAAIYDRLLYVEQPFPYELEELALDVRSIGSRKPIFLDESAHDWRCVRLGRELGWTGVALKTCKTQSGALLSLCWAKAHGMPLMVQDLTNPMLAQIPHVRLAAHAGTIMGVESNAMQYYPAASAPEARVHPGLYHRRDGVLDLASIRGPGFGYRVDDIDRILPDTQPAN